MGWVGSVTQNGPVDNSAVNITDREPAIQSEPKFRSTLNRYSVINFFEQTF